MKKLLASVLVFALFFFGCGKCPPHEKYFDIEGVQSIYVINNDPKSTSNFIPSDSISFEHFGLRTDYSVSYYSAIKQNSFSFVPAAYALDCAEDGAGGTKEKIESIDLIATTDFNATYKTGMSLNPIIKIFGLPVSQFIINQNQYGLNQLGFDFTLTEKPDSTVKQAFKVVFKLDNGETYEAESKPIRIY